MVLKVVAAVVIGYLLGSIPSAYIAGRLKKSVDIRQVGGGNMGALNVMRGVGTAAGYAVAVTDVAKGSLAVLFAQWLGLPQVWILVAGFMAIAGHNWPVFLQFKGGKGGATAMGVLLALVPLEFGIGFAVTVVTVIITSNPALGQAIGMACMPLVIWQLNGSGMLVGFSLAVFIFVAIRYSLAGLRRAREGVDIKKGLIFSREYHFWQVKKK
ncbi:MAG: glycerol-3-phosphate acyltransferase [Dehalococcoidales bacterium]|nr:glycerol-3-phosphate acyltransferase [Dehalococcoidales bacterium]